MLPLLLASSSVYRRSLLAKLQVPFTWHSPAIDEQAQPGESARDLVARLAQQKARALADDYPDTLIIGSDQAAQLNGEIIGKPADREQAIQQLRRASGQCVSFHTGLALYNSQTRHMQMDVVTYRVFFRTLSDAQIKRYIEREAPLDCAGSFKSEGLGITLFTKMQGDDPNALIGLPLIRLCDLLANEGVELP